MPFVPDISQAQLAHLLKQRQSQPAEPPTEGSYPTDPKDGSGYYGSAATEPVVELLKPSEAWVVENRYGSEVLVTRDLSALPMVDVDGPGSIPLFHERLMALELYGSVELRCYRTAEGWRLLVVSDSLRPDGPLFELLHRGMGGDERYLKLCQKQQTYRARLTPKPWRNRDGSDRAATCRFEGSIGACLGSPCARLIQLVELHDQRTRALEKGDLFLA